MPWVNKTLLTQSSDGHDFVLFEDLLYRDIYGNLWKCPKGSTSDGISTPAELWVTDPPFGQGRWFPGIWHDCSPKYRCTLEVMYAGTTVWTVPQLSFTQCNRMLRDMLVEGGMDAIKADAYFEALQLAGGTASENDLGLPIPKL